MPLSLPLQGRYLIIALAVFALLIVPALALAAESVTVTLAPANGSNVQGTLILTANGDATDALLDLTGMAPNAEGTATLYANTCELPSASFAPVAKFTADANGNVHATGAVLFHETNVALADIADNQHVIGIHSGGQMVACGVVPALATAPDLPNTGGAFEPTAFALVGGLGILLLATGLVIRRREI